MKEQFFDASSAKSYAEGPPRQVPGYFDIHKMVSVIFAERVPAEARVLAHGAGGGQELKSFADRHAGWSFDAVDPSPDMLRAAEEAVGPHAARMRFHSGYIDAAPEGPFDAATSILVFHFIPLAERLETLKQIRQRLKPGAPFAIVHLSFSQSEPERSAWIARHIAFAFTGEPDQDKLQRARNAIRERLTILSPGDDVAMLRQAGFFDVTHFYTGMSMKGWVAYAG